jgi:hypothetical protein
MPKLVEKRVIVVVVEDLKKSTSLEDVLEQHNLQQVNYTIHVILLCACIVLLLLLQLQGQLLREHQTSSSASQLSDHLW